MSVNIKIRCISCGYTIMMTRRDFEKKLKKIIEKNAEKE